MAKKAIREFDAKRMLAEALPGLSGGRFTYAAKLALVAPADDLEALPAKLPWLLTAKLVVKPDQLFGKRGKNKLVLVDADWPTAKSWIRERMNKTVTIQQTTGTTTGVLTHFLIEEFVPHGTEYYVAMRSFRDHDTIYVSTHGGVNVEEAWSTVVETQVGVLEDVDAFKLRLPDDLQDRDTCTAFVKALYRFFVQYHYAYLELNPFSMEGGRVVPLDAVARVDDYAAFECAERWGDLPFPKAFGMAVTPEEERIEELDSRTGASLKLTVLNPAGRIWNLVAGGGASVIYADTVCDLGLASELANYGEYSGDPCTEDTYEYTKVVLDLMTRTPDPAGRPKFLLVGGGIANFTDVANTFKGVIKAIEEFKDRLQAVKARIFVRRGGPNYEGGLARFRELGGRLGLPVQVFGPETHMTHIVRMVKEG